MDGAAWGRLPKAAASLMRAGCLPALPERAVVHWVVQPTPVQPSPAVPKVAASGTRNRRDLLSGPFRLASAFRGRLSLWAGLSTATQGLKGGQLSLLAIVVSALAWPAALGPSCDD